MNYDRDVLENGNCAAPALPNRWTPKLKGLIFCSDACGCGCTRASFDEATHKAQHLAHVLGHGWAPHVWENCGWHWEAINRNATVTKHSDGQHEACVRFHMQDNVESCVSETRLSARQAVAAVVQHLQARIHALKRAVDSLAFDSFMIQTTPKNKKAKQ